jgi:hypothetical protein
VAVDEAEEVDQMESDKEKVMAKSKGKESIRGQVSQMIEILNEAEESDEVEIVEVPAKRKGKAVEQ